MYVCYPTNSSNFAIRLQVMRSKAGGLKIAVCKYVFMYLSAQHTPVEALVRPYLRQAAAWMIAGCLLSPHQELKHRKTVPICRSHLLCVVKKLRVETQPDIFKALRESPARGRRVPHYILYITEGSVMLDSQPNTRKSACSEPDVKVFS